MTTTTPKAAPTTAEVDRLLSKALDHIMAAQEAFQEMGSDRCALQAGAVLMALRGALLSGEHASAALDNLMAAAASAAQQNLDLLTARRVADRVN